jgi:cytochrome c556
METRAIFVALTLLAPAQKLGDEQEYRKRMHDIDHSFVAIQEDRRMSRPSEIEKEAAKLRDLFAEVEEFWKGRGENEAAGFARMAKEGAREAVEAARKKEQKALEAAIQSIAASCEGCHKEPLDKYRFPKS